jgi:hypothetical protein
VGAARHQPRGGGGLDPLFNRGTPLPAAFVAEAGSCFGETILKVLLSQIAHARSGDKGDGSNVGLIANHEAAFEILRQQVTEKRVKEHFGELCQGRVERFEVPNLLALNFLLHDSLGGGGTESLKIDAQGKTHGQGLLQLEVEVPEGFVLS